MTAPDREPTPSPDRDSLAREHLANERTLLAWVRTALALMGTGFLIARLDSGSPEARPLGVLLVAAGMGSLLLATGRYFRARTQIEQGRFEPEYLAEAVVVATTLIAGAALIVYLAAAR